MKSIPDINIGEISAVNTTSNTKEVWGEIYAATCEQYTSCHVCKAKIVEISAHLGECTKCHLKIKLSKCTKKLVAKLFIEKEDGTEVMATAFDEVIQKITCKDSSDTTIEEKLTTAGITKFYITSDIISDVEL